MRQFKYGLSFFLFFALLWWSLTENSSTQVWMGAILVAIASITALNNLTTEKFPIVMSLRNFVHFTWYFISQSIRGGIQVALLAFMPTREINPGYHKYKTRIPEEAEFARMCFASCLSIFPGTLSCGYVEDILIIHILDEPLFKIEEIQFLEDLTIRTFMRINSINTSKPSSSN